VTSIRAGLEIMRMRLKFGTLL